LGVTKGGRWAFLTNFREVRSAAAHTISISTALNVCCSRDAAPTRMRWLFLGLAVTANC
jgi:hypothetical protein